MHVSWWDTHSIGGSGGEGHIHHKPKGPTGESKDGVKTPREQLHYDAVAERTELDPQRPVVKKL